MWVKKKWPLLALAVLFVASVGLRWGAFSTQAVSQYTATGDRFTNSEIFQHTGYVFHIYDTYEVREHKFMSYVGASEKFMQRKGIPELYIYTSFPSTLFVVPYAIFTLFGFSTSLIHLDIFNLILQFITVVLLFYLIMAILPKGNRRNKELVAFLGASAYIFATGTLHYHLNVYWAHELLQPVLVGALLLFARRRGLFKWWEAAGIGFVLSIITWTGMVAAAGMGLYALWKFVRTKDKSYLKMLLGLGGGAVTALIMIVSYAIAGTGSDLMRYVSAVSNRVEARTLANEYYQPVLLTRQFIIWMFEDYGAYILLAFTMAMVYIRKIKPTFAWAVVAVAAFPILESFILVEHDAVYGFGRLKWLTPVILVAALTGYEFLGKGKKQTKRRLVLIGAFTLAAVFHAWWYWYLYKDTFGK